MLNKYTWAVAPIIIVWLLLMGLISDKYDALEQDYIGVSNATK